MALRQEIARVKTEMLAGDVRNDEIGLANDRSTVGSGNLDWPSRRLLVSLVKTLPGNEHCADCSSLEGANPLH